MKQAFDDNYHQEVIKRNSHTLYHLVPMRIVDDFKKWSFFLQEGQEVDNKWNFSKEMTDIQQIKLYRFIKNHKLNSGLANTIEAKYKLKNTNLLELKIVASQINTLHFDFFVNQEQLSKKLGIDRFNLAYSAFEFDLSIVKLPNYDRKQLNKMVTARFLGNIEASNQFGTNRIVLYRCHCGCDYCGVISFVLIIKEHSIIWKDIRYENDDDSNRIGIKPIDELCFNKIEYEFEFNKYLAIYCS